MQISYTEKFESYQKWFEILAKNIDLWISGEYFYVL